MSPDAGLETTTGLSTTCPHAGTAANAASTATAAKPAAIRTAAAVVPAARRRLFAAALTLERLSRLRLRGGRAEPFLGPVMARADAGRRSRGSRGSHGIGATADRGRGRGRCLSNSAELEPGIRHHGINVECREWWKHRMAGVRDVISRTRRVKPAGIVRSSSSSIAAFGSESSRARHEFWFRNS